MNSFIVALAIGLIGLVKTSMGYILSALWMYGILRWPWRKKLSPASPTPSPQPPTRHARNANDVVVPDMRKLTQIMAAARRAGLVKAAAASNVWITEMSWDSFPDPNGLTLDQQAKYMEGAFYVLWKSGVKHILWWNSRDDAQGSDWNATLQSGIFLRGADPSLDTPKPSYTAYHFPFTAYRSQGVASLWAFPPAAGPVTVQALTGAGTWTTVATLAPKGGGVDTGSLRVGQGTSLRAVQGTEISLSWTT